MPDNQAIIAALERLIEKARWVYGTSSGGSGHYDLLVAVEAAEKVLREEADRDKSQDKS